MAICPHLTAEELCTIYDDRPKCCRTFPNRVHPNCIDAYRCDLNCKECKDKCCKHILLTDKNFISSLDVSCNQCKQIWVGQNETK